MDGPDKSTTCFDATFKAPKAIYNFFLPVSATYQDLKSLSHQRYLWTPQVGAIIKQLTIYSHNSAPPKKQLSMGMITHPPEQCESRILPSDDATEVHFCALLGQTTIAPTHSPPIVGRGGTLSRMASGVMVGERGQVQGTSISISIPNTQRNRRRSCPHLPCVAIKSGQAPGPGSLNPESVRHRRMGSVEDERRSPLEEGLLPDVRFPPFPFLDLHKSTLNLFIFQFFLNLLLPSC